MRHPHQDKKFFSERGAREPRQVSFTAGVYTHDRTPRMQEGGEGSEVDEVVLPAILLRDGLLGTLEPFRDDLRTLICRRASSVGPPWA